jgi:hypothetical protein
MMIECVILSVQRQVSKYNEERQDRQKEIKRLGAHQRSDYDTTSIIRKT